MGDGPDLSFYRCAFALVPSSAPVSKAQAAAIFADLSMEPGLTGLDVSPDGAPLEHARWHGPGVAVFLQPNQQLTLERTGGGRALDGHEALSREIGTVVDTIRRHADIGGVWAPQLSLAGHWALDGEDAYQFLNESSGLLAHLDLDGFSRPAIGLRMVERDQEAGMADLKIEPWFVNPTALYLELTVALPQDAMAVADDWQTVSALAARAYTLLGSTARALGRWPTRRVTAHG